MYVSLAKKSSACAAAASTTSNANILAAIESTPATTKRCYLGQDKTFRDEEQQEVWAKSIVTSILLLPPPRSKSCRFMSSNCREKVKSLANVCATLWEFPWDCPTNQVCWRLNINLNPNPNLNSILEYNSSHSNAILCEEFRETRQVASISLVRKLRLQQISGRGSKLSLLLLSLTKDIN